MDMMHVFSLTGLEWIYDKVEDRYGRVAAWVVTLAFTAAVIGVAVAVWRRFT
jgi:hypothetical protein